MIAVILWVYVTVIVCVAVYYLYKHPFLRVRGNSMYPTYKDGDIVIGLRYNHKHCSIGQNSIVVVNSPSGVRAIKRITKFKYESGKMLIWVEGDNASNSYDSRSYGWLSVKDIVAIDPRPREKKESI